MKSYHFCLGNSSEGPIGYCARVLAETPEEAVDILRSQLRWDEVPVQTDGHDIEYVAVYFNPGAVTVDDINEINEV